MQGFGLRVFGFKMVPRALGFLVTGYYTGSVSSLGSRV